jgi:hypothetical protein
MTLGLWVVDTNVLVAALLTAQADSPTARTLDAMLDGSLMFVLSPALLAEYRAVLLRPRLAQRHGLTEAEVDELLATITANAIWREPHAPSSSPMGSARLRTRCRSGHWRPGAQGRQGGARPLTVGCHAPSPRGRYR